MRVSWNGYGELFYSFIEAKIFIDLVEDVVFNFVNGVWFIRIIGPVYY